MSTFGGDVSYKLIGASVNLPNDQTDEIEKSFPKNHLGTGVFLIPNPEKSGPHSVTKKIVPGITYGDCLTRGMHCIAFKWTHKILEKTPETIK